MAPRHRCAVAARRTGGRFVMAATGVASLLLAHPIAGQETNAFRGTVLDASPGAPIRAAVVEVRHSPGRQLTDAQGRFLFAQLAPGRHIVLTSALGYEADSSEVEVGAAGATRIALQPKPVPLKGLEALVQPQKPRMLRGMRLRTWGREDLLSLGDVRASTFVREKAHLPLEPCATTAPAGIAEDCIAYTYFRYVGGRYLTERRANPVMVFVDGQRWPWGFSQLDAIYAWDVGRIQVYSSKGAALVQVLTNNYIERAAPKIGGKMCNDVITPTELPGADRVRALYHECGI